jgi:hypothetical protein
MIAAQNGWSAMRKELLNHSPFCRYNISVVANNFQSGSNSRILAWFFLVKAFVQMVGA